MQFLVQFVHKHHDFQIQELEALARIENVSLTLLSPHSPTNPFLLVEMDSILCAQKLIKRSILIKNICEFWESAPDLEALKECLLKNELYKERQLETCSFKYLVASFGLSISLSQQMERIHSLNSVLQFKGAICLDSPNVTYAYFEYYGHNSADKRSLKKVYFGVLIAEGSGSRMVNTLDLKKRSYVGTTSMDAELSLLSANQALVMPGSLVYDPFVGTGSFLVAAGYFGGYVLGSDIDGRKQHRIMENMKQYALESKFVGTVAADMAHNPWRRLGAFDAIICDPPYGIREGARRIMHTNDSPFKKNGIDLRYPKTEPYDLSEIIVDLVAFAVMHLRDGGRLVFWLPSPNELYDPQDIPIHASLKLISVSIQPFGKWSRRLITMEKIGIVDEMERISIKQDSTPSHSKFRDYYFRPSA